MDIITCILDGVRRLFDFPAIKVYRKLPQWIKSSEIVCYHPATNTIHIKRGQQYWLFHEIGHWFACKFELQFIHDWLDGEENVQPR